MTTTIGFCSKCHLIRQDDASGPVTPCACFVDHHRTDCDLRIAVRGPIAIPCTAHGRDSCPACFPCTCGVAADRMFVCNDVAFVWESDVGLVIAEFAKKMKPAP